MPDIVLHGRFWAEEGNFFFPRAWQMPWWQALVQPGGGYLNVVANAGGVLAHDLVPLRMAPFVTILVALVCQSCPLLVLLSARDRWLQDGAVLLAATILLATPAAVDEVWLNSIHSQFQLGLANALVLALEPVAGPIGRLRLGVLALGPLAGPASLFLLPLFVLRLLIERTTARLAQCLALGSGSAAQLLLFYQPGTRQYGIAPALLVAIVLVKQICVPLLGHDMAGRIGSRLRDLSMRGGPPLWFVAPGCLAVLAFCVASLRAHVAAARWLVLAALSTAILSYYAAIGGGAMLLLVDFGGRYALIPSMLLTMSLLAMATDRAHAGTRRVCMVQVAWIAVIGIKDALLADRPLFAHGPNWAAEVRRWQAEPGHVLAIWPRGWTVRLPPGR